jgi:triacylglycerol lipase
MAAINGISFENWAAACAHIAQGMGADEVCSILGVELPVWEEANKKWGDELGRLMSEDMAVATQYGQIFTNPKVGKFADVAATSAPEDALMKVPDYDTYNKIFWHQSIAHDHGIDPVTVLESDYGMSLTEWSQVAMHWSNYVQQKTANPTDPEYEAWRLEDLRLRDKWQAHFNEVYKDQKPDLADDIDF